MSRSPGLRALLLSALALALPASAAFAQTGYIAFGDSITAGVYDDPARAEPGYPPRLEALLVSAGINAVVENHGLGGEDTSEGITRIDEVLNTSALSGDVLLLMEGTNDFAKNIGIETTRRLLNEMALKAERRGLSVIHATVIPRLPNARFDSLNVGTTILNQNIRDMANRRERKLADPFEVFSTTPDLYNRFYYQGADDPVGHPNAAGYDLLAQIFFDVIRNVDRVPPVTGMTEPLHGSREVSPNAPVEMDVLDFGQGIDLSATSLLINGAPVTATLTGDAKRAHLSWQPTVPLTGTVSVGLRSRDLASPPNTVDREVARYTVAGTQSVRGDVDQDGRVDGADLLRFARRFGSRVGDVLYLQSADFNEDGVIDGQDLAILASNFGRNTAG